MHPEPTIDLQLLALPESAGSSLYGMYDVLKTCGRVWREISRLESAPDLFQTRIVSTSIEPFRCGYDIPVMPEVAIGSGNTPNIIVITDFWLSPDESLIDKHAELKAWLSRCWADGTTIYSACSGSVLLAAAGLLDGMSATSHWVYQDLFDTEFPKVTFDPQPTLCFSDPSGRLVTAGGASSWHDLALYIISRHISPAEAIQTAKFFLMKWHAEGQLPYSNRVRRRPHADSAVRRAELWLADNLRSQDPVAEVVEVIGIPERSLKRRFTKATGTSLIQYIQNLRVEAAKEALESSRQTIDEVAYNVGYENVAFFRRLFRRSVGLSPSEYRRLYEPFQKSNVPVLGNGSGGHNELKPPTRLF